MVPSWGRRMNLHSWCRPLCSQRLEESLLQFPHLDSRGLCLSPIDIIMEPQLGSPIQCWPPPTHIHRSWSSNHTPPPAFSSTALDPGQPPPNQVTRWAPETLPLAKGCLCAAHSAGGGEQGRVHFTLDWQIEAWGGGSMCLSFLPNDNRIFIISENWGDFPGGSDSKESTCNAGNVGSIPGSGRSPGEGNSNPLQYSCLENPLDRGAWLATVHGVARVGYDWATGTHKPILKGKLFQMRPQKNSKIFAENLLLN